MTNFKNIKYSLQSRPVFESITPINEQCKGHPEVRAIDRCYLCRQPICLVCRFKLPGGQVICPECASAPGESSMTNLRILMVVLAGIILLLFPASYTSVKFFGNTVGGLIIYATYIGGILSSYGALEKHLPNPWYVWLLVVLHTLMSIRFIINFIMRNLIKA